MAAIWNGFLDIIWAAMQFVYSFTHDWGISIIVITILFRLIVWPLMVKQVRSMRGMQKLQPLMKEIQEKYKDDKEKQSQEMMNLYKEQGINPLGGCLPMLLQMPLMIGFFAVIMVPQIDSDGVVQTTMYGLGRLPEYLGYQVGVHIDSLNTQTAPFLDFGNWAVLPNITQTPAGMWAVNQGQAIPYIVLLVLSSVAILLPTLMNQKGMPDTPQARQQKFIGYGMSVFMAFIGWTWFSGGVLLYLTTSSFFAAGQQFFVMRQMDREEEAEKEAIEEAKAKKKAERKANREKNQNHSKSKKKKR